MDRESLLTAFRFQAGACRYLGSPFYGELMQAAYEDVERGGSVAALLADWRGDPIRGFLPLRLFGAVHERVLAGAAPALASFYPTAGGRADAAAAWPQVLALVEQQGDALLPWLERFPQTNEVRRCAGLLGGFLELASRAPLPLRLREIGCSAGLNLGWSRYRYALGPHRWGDPASPVRIACEWQGAPPPLDAAPAIESRAGCDLAPPRIADDADVRALEAYVWPDQPERLEQLRGAIAIARRDPPRVDRARAADWLEAELADVADDVCTVVYHSSLWLYLSPEEQMRVARLLAEHGAHASVTRPLAWLRHEDTGPVATVEIRLSVWPGGEERLLGQGHPHGRRVEWGGDVGERPPPTAVRARRARRRR